MRRSKNYSVLAPILAALSGCAGTPYANTPDGLQQGSQACITLAAMDADQFQIIVIDPTGPATVKPSTPKALETLAKLYGFEKGYPPNLTGAANRFGIAADLCRSAAAQGLVSAGIAGRAESNFRSLDDRLAPAERVYRATMARSAAEFKKGPGI
jgi:hypothetical protein